MTSHTEEARVLVSLEDFKDQRCEEYAARLPPIEDLNLPPAQRPFSEGENPSLHLGFQCPWPEISESVTDPVKEIYDRLRKVNRDVKAAFREPGWRLIEVRSVAERPLYSNIFVVAFYIDVHRKLKDDALTKKRLGEVLEALRKAFGERVEGPKWYWDATVHGAEAHVYIPFDEAYPSGYPIFSSSSED